MLKRKSWSDGRAGTVGSAAAAGEVFEVDTVAARAGHLLAVEQPGHELAVPRRIRRLRYTRVRQEGAA
jgi:hypothetical protein